MKSLFSKWRGAVALPVVFLCALALLALAFKAHATSIRGFSVGNNAYGATNAYAIVPAVGDRVAVLRSLNVTTDSGVGRITIYTNGPGATVSYDTTSSNIQVSATGTNGLAAGDNIVIAAGNTPNDTYFRVRVVTVSTTNILYTPTITPTIPAGSQIYRQGTNAVLVGITNGATAASLSSGGAFIAVGQKGQPMLIDIWGGSVCLINSAGGEFLWDNEAVKP